MAWCRQAAIHYPNEGPVLLLRHGAVARVLANGNAVFSESCAAIGWKVATASDRCSKTGPSVDQDLQRHMASLGPDELKSSGIIITIRQIEHQGEKRKSTCPLVITRRLWLHIMQMVHHISLACTVTPCHLDMCADVICLITTYEPALVKSR